MLALMASSPHDSSGPSGSPIPGFFAVVPAGRSAPGCGRSRAGSPKFLLDLTGSGRSCSRPRWTGSCRSRGAGRRARHGDRHVAAARTQLPALPAENVLAEPSPRDSMAAIGLAAAVLDARHGDVVVGSFAADQVITGRDSFESSVREAVEAARAGYVVTIGIAASRPSTAFGYVHSGAPLGVAGAPTAQHVRGFTEKPDAATAQRYLASGEYRWNAGMFIVRSSVLLGHLADQRPELHDGLRAIAAAWDGPDRDRVLAERWPALRADRDRPRGGRAGRRGRRRRRGPRHVRVGRRGRLQLPRRPPAVRRRAGSKVLGDTGRVVRRESAGSVVVPASDRVVTVLGLDDVVVVDTPDALLVTTRRARSR